MTQTNQKPLRYSQKSDVSSSCVSFLDINHCHSPFQIIDELYGLDFDGPHPSEEYDGPTSCYGTSSVEVPQTKIAVTTEAQQQLRTINPLRDSEVYGVEINAEVMQILSK